MICASSPIGVTSHITPLSNRRGAGGEASVFSVCRRPSVGWKRWWKSSVKSVSSVRERNILRERRNSPRQFSNILFLTDNTDEQNTQGFTETLSQPISQNVTATEASPPAPLRMERGVITEIPLHVLRMLSSPSPPITSPIGVTSHTTPLSIRRGAGGEALLFFLLPQPFFPPFLAHSPYFS